MGKIRTNSYFYNARSRAFFNRVPWQRVERAVAMTYIRDGRMKPWSYSKEQVLGSSVTINLDYSLRPVRLVGTVMDAHHFRTNLRGAMKLYARNEDANIMMWMPMANPKFKYELTSTHGSFENYLNERDKWDEAYLTGTARVR